MSFGHINCFSVKEIYLTFANQGKYQTHRKMGTESHGSSIQDSRVTLSGCLAFCFLQMGFKCLHWDRQGKGDIENHFRFLLPTTIHQEEIQNEEDADDCPNSFSLRYVHGYFRTGSQKYAKWCQ